MTNHRPDDDNPSPPSFTDAYDPISYLKTPEDQEHPEDPLTTFQEALDTLDPGAWALKAINFFFGSDPIEQAMEKLGGDWKAYGRAAEVYKNLGDFFQAVGWNLKVGNDELDGYWGGQSADAAYISFDTVAQECIAHKAVLDQLHDNYKTAESAAYHFAIAGGPIAAAIIDAAIVCGIGIAAGTATSETVVGGLIGYGAAGWEAFELIEGCDKLMRLIGLTDAAIQAVVGQVGMIVGSTPDVVAGFNFISLAGGMGPVGLPGGE